MNDLQIPIAAEGQHSSFIRKEQFFTVGTQNVKGFTRKDKQDTFFFEYINTYNLDIIGLTETKLKKNQEKFLSKNNKKNIITDNITGDLAENTFQNRVYKEHYQTWWTCSTNFMSAGVGLAIKHSFASYVFNIEKFNGRAIKADLQFKGKSNLEL